MTLPHSSTHSKTHSNFQMLSATLCTLTLLAGAATCTAQETAPATPPSSTTAPQFTNVLYGAAYYPEYEPTDHLNEDIALMKAAGLTVVRMGESTWSLWEPRDGAFETAWMDRAIDALSKAGIKIIMGTPTYSVPAWMAKKHPEMLVVTLDGKQATYGMRQNMDTDNPDYRFYAERIIRKMVEHYKYNPAVIGWQVDNETASYGAANPDVFQGFVRHLQKKFGTTDALNKAWLLNYWGQDVNDWNDMPTRASATSTAYKLEWTRWEQMRVTDFLTWQAALVRKYRRPDQFVTQDFSDHLHRDVNEGEVAKALDIVSVNPYFRAQDRMDGEKQTLDGDYYRSLKQQNYLVTETNAQTTDWSSSFQFPPYDGQLRLNVYTHLSSGANMVEYWHWHSIHSGQETYWKGILSHDMEPNRIYAEFTRTAHELDRIGPHLVNLKIKNEVAILYSVDSANALDFMPFASPSPQWSFSPAVADYTALLDQLHHALYLDNVGTDFILPDSTDLARYKLIVVPALYIADDALLERLSNYVKQGGHILMTFKSGFANENSMVRDVRAPGPLRAAAGFSYQEFSNLETPLKLKGDPFGAGEDNKVSYWAEFLIPDHAKVLATYDHPFFGQWPAITQNSYGKGTLTYEGTWLSDTLQRRVVTDALKQSGVEMRASQLPPSVRVKSGTNAQGKQIHYLLNYSSESQTFTSPFSTGTDLLTGKAIPPQTSVTLKPWDLIILEEN